ncbi:MAG: GNAT family N-acetyltransferase, partial [Roseibium sp.]|uniref:GNAT family N-acetyltransferase n=1 Tax=Roseibium sp. TaxID=1936156 RepID=UPI0026197463
LSPGMVLFVKSIEWAQENGIRNFSLGAGLQGYKHRFGGVLQDARKLWVPTNLGGRTYVTALHAKQLAESMLERSSTKA